MKEGRGVETPLTSPLSSFMRAIGNSLSVPATVGWKTVTSSQGHTSLLRRQHSTKGGKALTPRRSFFIHCKQWLKPGDIHVFPPSASFRTQICILTASSMCISRHKVNPHKCLENQTVLYETDTCAGAWFEPDVFGETKKYSVCTTGNSW